MHRSPNRRKQTIETLAACLGGGRVASQADCELLAGWRSRHELDAAIVREALAALAYHLPLSPHIDTSIDRTGQGRDRALLSDSGSNGSSVLDVIEQCERLQQLFSPELSPALLSTKQSPAAPAVDLVAAIIDSQSRCPPPRIISTTTTSTANEHKSISALRHSSLAAHCISSRMSLSFHQHPPRHDPSEPPQRISLPISTKADLWIAVPEAFRAHVRGQRRCPVALAMTDIQRCLSR